ncbi:MAG TPA: DUF1684 domain-containing protein [Tahibacter sp.]|nr:DUF1684 domain-containing protein [Tahibacter sp.]
MVEVSAIVLAGIMAGSSVQATNVSVEADAGPGDHTSEIQAWRKQRVDRLKTPTGWLSLVGLHWLKDGEQTVGSGKDNDNDVVLNVGPARLGKVTLKNGDASIALDAKAGAKIDGADKVAAPLVDDRQEKPTTISFGTANFYVIDRDGKKALRVKDSEAATRKNFLGIDYYDIAAKWRIEAKWEAFDPPRTLEVPTVLGTVEKYPVPGKATFEIGGKKYEITPVIEVPGDKELFIIFADRTSGKETYGAGRFLYAPMPANGKIVLDFNKAYNPPCAFTPYATCPLAPPENRLDLPVTAGEKKYRGSHH